MIEVIDKRPQPPRPTIHWTNAIPGNLYETVGGRGQPGIIIMAALMPAKPYREAFPECGGLCFVHTDGRVYPNTTEHLIPLKGTIEWFITGEEQ